MAYTFSNTQGDVTVSVNDNQLDQSTYSLTLLGKNVTNYGQIIAQNTIRQLENFASTSAPSPSVKLVGQLWFSKSTNHLHVYKNQVEGFTELAYKPKKSATDPLSSRGSDIEEGELYFDTANENLRVAIDGGSGAVWNNVISDSYIRSRFTGGTGVTYTSSTGDIAIGQAVETTSNVQFNNVVVDGNLTVNGTQTILNTETLTVDDNLIVLNNNATGSATENAGIEVERGDDTNVLLRWNESSNIWQFTNDGSTYYPVATSTTDLAEGSNLYFTDARARSAISVTDSGGDGSLSYNSSNGVITYTGPSAAEVQAHFSSGTNTTYSAGSFSISDSTIRSKVFVTDTGGDGSLTYNNSNGEFTFTGPSASEVRAHFSAGGDLSYNSATGEFSYTRGPGDIESVGAGNGLTGGGTSGAVTLNVGAGTGITVNANDIAVDMSAFSTTNLSEGTNLYYTDSRVINAVASSDITTQNIVATGPSGTYDVGSSSVKYGTMYANTFSGTASSAQYADLAEKYLADAEYEVGTVLIFGGKEEVTVTNKQNNPSIAGVVSENPAYLMNAELEGNHVVSVALKGRVPVKVVGPIKKGDVLIHSHTEGHAQAAPFGGYHVTGPCCIGIAISEKADAGAGLVEALVK